MGLLAQTKIPLDSSSFRFDGDLKNLIVVEYVYPSRHKRKIVDATVCDSEFTEQHAFRTPDVDAVSNAAVNVALLTVSLLHIACSLKRGVLVRKSLRRWMFTLVKLTIVSV